MADADRSTPVFRVDKFVVPVAARGEFLDKVRRTHELLKKQQGFRRDLVLEQSSGPGRFNFVTLVEWESEAAVEGAKAAIMAMHREIGFSAKDMFVRLGIEADVANYSPAEG